MKRYIKQVYDPFASSLGYSDEEQNLIYTWVAQLQKEAEAKFTSSKNGNKFI